MRIISKIKGVDDFGKETINKYVSKYEHHYPRMQENDILIYYYPKDNAIGLYQVEKELTYYYKDGFQHTTGLMNKLNLGTIQECIADIERQNYDLAKEIVQKVMEIFKRYGN